MDLDGVADLLEDLLEALSVIHAKRFLHRDIKPENIIRRSDGSVVLLDFGAARQAIADDQQDITVILTPGYAPPEQYHSDEPQGPWTDLYSLAATALFCLTSERPAESSKRMLAERKGLPDPLLQSLEQCALHDTDPAMADLLSWMLQPTPEQRPRNAEDALAALAGDEDKVGSASAPADRTVAYGDHAEPTTSVTVKAPPPRRSETSITNKAIAADIPSDGIKALGKALAAAIGPMGPILAKKRAKKADSIKALAVLLADEIDEDSAKTQFETAATRIIADL
jgi:serine/threonine protein kinase